MSLENQEFQFEPYFTKSKNWAAFWQQNQDDLIKHFELDCEMVYEFKYKMGTKFWYIPHFCESKILDKERLDSFKSEARKNKIDFITTEISDKAKFEQNITTNFKKAIRKTQYNATILVKTKNLKYDQGLNNFTSLNQDLVANFASSFRRKVKKSLKENWSVSTEKNVENLENFWKVYTQTAERQKFKIHPKKYYRNLFNLKNSRVIILFNAEGEVCGGWLGWQSDKNLTYLYGGNNEEALEKLGQYIIQLTAIQICTKEGLDFYDLGGYEKDTGYGRFKEGFHGILREFPGPFDIVINPIKYNILKTMSKVKSILGKKK